MPIARELLAELAGSNKNSDAQIGKAIRNIMPTIQAAQQNRRAQQIQNIKIQQIRAEQEKAKRISNIIMTSIDLKGQVSPKLATQNVLNAGFVQEAKQLQELGSAQQIVADKHKESLSKLKDEEIDRQIQENTEVGKAFGAVVLAKDDGIDLMLDTTLQRVEKFMNPDQVKAARLLKTPEKIREFSQAIMLQNAERGQALTFLTNEKNRAVSKLRLTAEYARSKKRTIADAKIEILDKFLNAYVVAQKTNQPVTAILVKTMTDGERMVLGEVISNGLNPELAANLAENLPASWMGMLKNNPNKFLTEFKDLFGAINTIVQQKQQEILKGQKPTPKISDETLKAHGWTRSQLNKNMQRHGLTDESIALRAMNAFRLNQQKQ